MNTLNMFPDLLTFGLIAPFILRITVGVMFIYFGYTQINKKGGKRVLFLNKMKQSNVTALLCIISAIEVIGGIFLAIGLFTQITAIILSIVTLGAIFVKIKKPDSLNNSLVLFILLLSVLLSLLFLGAGFWAIDLPL